MFRISVTGLLLIFVLSSAQAQGIRTAAPPPRIPPQRLQPFSPLQPALFNNGFTTPFLNPYAHFNPFSYNLILPYQIPYIVQTAPIQQPALESAIESTSRKLPMPKPDNPAQFKLTFPVAATLWVNGEKQADTHRQWTITAPDDAENYKVDVQARWTLNNQEYEWKRDITVAKGETAAATVLRGHPVAK